MLSTITDYYLSDLVVTSCDAASTALVPEDVLGLVPGPGPRLTSDKQCIRKLARVKSGHHSAVKTASL